MFSNVELGPVFNAEVPYEVKGNTVVLKGIEVATEENFEEAWQDLLDQNTPLFEKQTENLTGYQLNFLRAIIDGVSKEFTTKNVLEKYNLGTSSNVAVVKRALIKKELIDTEKKEIVISDIVLKEWLRREFKML